MYRSLFNDHLVLDKAAVNDFFSESIPISVYDKTYVLYKIKAKDNSNNAF